MIKDETLKMALEALEADPLEMVADVDGHMVFLKDKAITAIKEALAQEQEQGPVAWWNDTGTHIDLNVSGRGAPLYTHPLQRTWVGLTAKEKHEFRYSHMTTADFIEDIEAKLKQKNGIKE